MLKNKSVRQTGLLFFARIFDLGIGFIINSIFLAKFFDTESYGIYIFILNLLIFISLFFDFGFLPSFNILINEEKEEQKEREYFGSYIFINAAFYVLFTFIILILSYVIDPIFNTHLENQLKFFGLLFSGFIFPISIASLLTGINKIRLLSLWMIASRLLFLILLAILYYTQNINPISINIIQSLAYTIMSIIVLMNIKCSFKNLKNSLNKVWEHTKSYGFDIYFSRLIDVVSYKLDTILLSRISTTLYGFYSLYFSFANPIYFFGNSIASAKYTDFTKEKKISKNILQFTFGGSILMGLGAYFIGLYIIKNYLHKTIPHFEWIFLIMVLAVAVNSCVQLFYTWLMAQGHSKEVRTKSIITTFINIIGNILLINYFNIIGAAIGSLLFSLVSLCILYFYYNKLKSE